MEKIRLGKTGMMVSQLGFGGIPIQKLAEDQAVAVVRRCLDLGVNFIDTADVYGNSEGRIGKAISGRFERPYIATKTDYGTRSEVESHLQQSLKRLRVEYIDLYQFHAVNDSETYEKVIDPDGPMSVVREAIRAGVVKHIGISSHSMEVARNAVESGLFETIMFPFNFVTCEAAEELLPLARENDVGFIAIKPLNAGMIENISIAFKYLRQFPDIISVPGIESIKEIEEIMRIYQGTPKMTGDEEQKMLGLREELGKSFCRRCGYCDSCPEGIRVSIVMDIRGIMNGMPPDMLFSEHFTKELDKVRACDRCGECEERCPYGLPIMELLEEYAAMYHSEKRRYMTSR